MDADIALEFVMTPYRFLSAGPAGRRGGFSLIEILVVMAIITLLSGLVIAGAAKMREQSRINQAQIILQAAKSLDIAYRAEVGSIVRYTGTSDPEEESIRVFVAAMQQLPETQKILMSIGKDFVINDPVNDPSDANDAPDIIVDPWGKPLQYRSWNDGTDFADPVHAGPAGAGNLPRRGTQTEPQPFFASAGPDGRWGEVNLNTNLPETGEDGEAATDNIYSFELD